MTTLIDLETQILMTIGVARPSQSLSAALTSMTTSALNILVNEWNAQGLLVPFTTQESFTLIPNQATYTWGTSGTTDFATARPINIRTMFIRDGGLDYPVDPIGRAEYEGITEKTDGGRPEQAWINQTYPNLSISFYFTPDAAYTLYVDSEKDLIDFSTLTATINLAPEYMAALKWNGAAEMWPMFFPQVAIPAKIEMRARETLTTLRRNNLAAKTSRTILSIFSVRQSTQGNIYNGFD